MRKRQAWTSDAAPKRHRSGSVALRIASARYSQVFLCLTIFMFSLRLFVLFGFIFLSQQTLRAQAESPAPEARPSTPPGPQITFNSVHVEGPYVAMTFDD